MEYSGPEPLINIEADLALSEDDDLSQEHWPKLNPPGHRKLAPTAAVPQPMDHATISTKRRMEPDSDSSSESPSPVAKSSKSGHNFVKVVSDNLRGPNFNIPEQAAVPDLPPWRVPLPTVTLTPTSKNVHPPLQKQLALETIASVSTRVVRDVLCQLAHAHDVSLVMSFVWMPSHIGLAGNDMADGLAKAACMLDVGDMAAEPSLRCQRNTIYSAGFAMTCRQCQHNKGQAGSVRGPGPSHDDQGHTHTEGEAGRAPQQAPGITQKVTAAY
ncbi:hypothetical protein Pcinc_015842 [Petrolisthes cinctipes]|uniref:RNase H type-1 domain-containing protein n=1 Tax=Petrolisthes cinctipes TaxID=88211 RepID=A0AAE1FS81_PETCI|nr:hypothetical protein Pcinc_015842 [Petrolisthes cinctipes]